MRFGETPLSEAEGAILGHSIRAGRQVFKKGRVLTAEDVATLQATGRDGVVAARLEPGDIGEDEAARRVAAAVAGPGTTASAPFTGRCNLFAEIEGLLVVDQNRIDRINLIDEAVTVATLAPYARVAAREMLATIKIIPFAAPEAVVARCEEIARGGGPVVRVARFKPLVAGLVMSSTPGMKPSILDRTAEATRARVAALGGSLPEENVVRTGHTEAELAAAIGKLVERGCGIIMVSGASAIVDRRDVVPAAIVHVGGVIDHFGMPVDPGNLLLIGHRGEVPMLGLPGCARSPALNGFDWVLERLFAGVAVGRADVMRMGAGGLLKEIASRPMPREDEKEARKPDAAVARAPKIAAIVLAAGQSRRMGPVNKLLADVDGRPMVAGVVDAALASKASPVVVVLGHQEDKVRAALAGRRATLVVNPEYAEGLSTSLQRGIAALPPDADGAVVCLGDMPAVSAATINRLIAAYDPVEGRAICVPTYNGKRGNPVLWDRRFFPEMAGIAGDVGARHLIGAHDDLVCEVAMADPGVLLDLDTPEALAAHLARRGKEA
jgi:molybdenum cofactor cytidylyltransferase